MPSLPCLTGRPRLPQTPSRQTASTLLPAWVHYLAQDLFVARWMAGDACNKRIPRLAMLPVLVLALLLGPAGPLLYFLLVRPLLGKSATTPKGTGKAKAAPAAAAQQAAPAKNGKQPAAAQQAQPAAAPAKKNGSAGKEAPAPAAPQQQQQQKPQQAKAKKGGLSAYALAAAEAATGPAPKKPAGTGTAAAGGKNGKTQAAAAPKPVERDIEDDRAFALAAAALLASRAKPQK